MTICLQRWKTHLRIYRFRVSLHRGGICLCHEMAILASVGGYLDRKPWTLVLRVCHRFNCWLHHRFKIGL